MGIKENIAAIREKIAAAAPQGAGNILLVAATKTNGAEAVREAVAAGVDACGENRVQEFLEKDALGAYEGTKKHFIGHLQKNKVSKIVGRVDLIQSVDSPELLTLIDRQAEKLNLIQDILIEISIAGETQKSGLPPENLSELLGLAGELKHISVRGLMCIPPLQTHAGANRVYFAKMLRLFVDNSGKKYNNIDMEFLSMGMSDDYEDAVREGANMVRVGSAIFGSRNKA